MTISSVELGSFILIFGIFALFVFSSWIDDVLNSPDDDESSQSMADDDEAIKKQTSKKQKLKDLSINDVTWLEVIKLYATKNKNSTASSAVHQAIQLLNLDKEQSSILFDAELGAN